MAVIGGFALVLLPTAAQTAWMCRPFLGRPAQAHVPFFRPKESSFADAIYRSTFSSVGVYEPVVNPPAGELGPIDDGSSERGESQ
jgi:hypothetical protein